MIAVIVPVLVVVVAQLVLMAGLICTNVVVLGCLPSRVGGSVGHLTPPGA